MPIACWTCLTDCLFSCTSSVYFSFSSSRIAWAWSMVSLSSSWSALMSSTSFERCAIVAVNSFSETSDCSLTDFALSKASEKLLVSAAHHLLNSPKFLVSSFSSFLMLARMSFSVLMTAMICFEEPWLMLTLAPPFFGLPSSRAAPASMSMSMSASASSSSKPMSLTSPALEAFSALAACCLPRAFAWALTLTASADVDPSATSATSRRARYCVIAEAP
mmetsp:Transcript_77277/g.202766  ORF Transcript_77277/g.202766 Transcript_77277/m.202766 type:complete len:219 (-) Transcript_77277:146-802(-)